MMPQAMDLKYFLTVCESRNISRASELLGISQPSLSLAIKRLEQLTGLPLFIRSKTGVEMTRAGIIFKQRAFELLEMWENLSSDIKKQHDSISGRYIIGAHISIALKLLPHIIEQLTKKYPQLEISLEHGLSRVLTDQVIGFAVDFAVVVNPTPHPDLVIRELQTDNVSFYAHPEVVDESVLIFDPHLLQTQFLLSEIKKRGLNFKRTITTSSLTMVDALVNQRIGIGILPGRVASRPARLWDDTLPQFQDRHCIIHRADAQQSIAARSLSKELFQLLVSTMQAQ